MTNAKKIVNKVMIALLAVVMVVASLGFAASMLAADNNSSISMNTDVQAVSSEMDNNTGDVTVTEITTRNFGDYLIYIDFPAAKYKFFIDAKDFWASQNKDQCRISLKNMAGNSAVAYLEATVTFTRKTEKLDPMTQNSSGLEFTDYFYSGCGDIVTMFVEFEVVCEGYVYSDSRNFNKF